MPCDSKHTEGNMPKDVKQIDQEATWILDAKLRWEILGSHDPLEKRDLK